LAVVTVVRRNDVFALAAMPLHDPKRYTIVRSYYGKKWGCQQCRSDNCCPDNLHAQFSIQLLGMFLSRAHWLFSCVFYMLTFVPGSSDTPRPKSAPNICYSRLDICHRFVADRFHAFGFPLFRQSCEFSSPEICSVGKAPHGELPIEVKLVTA